MAGRATDIDLPSWSWVSPALSPGEAVEVYFWSRREWQVGTFQLDDAGDAFVEIRGRMQLRYEAAKLMGLRRLLH